MALELSTVFETWRRLHLRPKAPQCFGEDQYDDIVVNTSNRTDAIDRAGAEIFFWLSAYDGGRDLSAKAWQYHRFLVSAVQTIYARILNNMGEILAITGIHDHIAASTIDLDVALFHTDFNKAQIPAIRAKYGPDVNLRLFHEEGCFTLQSNRPDLSVDMLIAEFQLDPLKDYIERNRRLQDALRAGDPLPVLQPPYGAREQWV